MKIDLKELNELIGKKYISVQNHPDGGLSIYNYTQKAQFERVWNKYTLMCRGLILDDEGNIIERPFEKFFNLGEYEDKKLPNKSFEVFEKLDGSLGILYHDPKTGKPSIATRGSFESDQAKVASQILDTRYQNIDWDKNLTYLFEIIYPANRIVVDYKELKDIVLLAVINTSSGEEIAIKVYEGLGMKTAKSFDGIKDVNELKELQEDNKEGFVIRYSNGLRLKLKFDEYVRLHKLVTGVNAKVIWELLKNNEPFDELLEKIPDEFYDWIVKTRNKLKGDFKLIESDSKIHTKLAKVYKTRKEQAEYLKKTKYPGISFAMLDMKNYKDRIWKLIKPKADVPFKEDIDTSK